MNQSVAEALLDLASRLRGPDGKTVQDELERRYPELEVTIAWLGEQGRVDDAVRLVATLGPFWMGAKRLEEGCDWFDHVLTLPGCTATVRGTACFHAGLLATWKGDDALAVARHREAVVIGSEHGLASIAAQALTGLARIALRSADTAEARRLCREALDLTEGTEDRVARSNALHVMGVAAQMAGDLLEARELMGERLAMARELGQIAAVASEAGNLSMVERQLGNLDGAEELARESLAIDLASARARGAALDQAAAVEYAITSAD